jgi:uncharacterized RDD family membrane protein YckC
VLKPVHTRPNAEGPRAGVNLSQQVELDRRGGGVRVIDTPYTRPPTPRRRAPHHWERSGVRPSGHLYVPTPPPSNPSPSPPSTVFVAKTEPNWIEEPEESRPATVPPVSTEPLIRYASMARRVLAWAIDAAAVSVAGALSLLVGLTFFGWSALAPALSRGFDEVFDSLIVGRQLWIFAAGMMLLIHFVYTTLAQGLAGTTLGQRLLRLHLETKDGEHPSLSDTAWRSGISFISIALGGIGVVWALFDPKHLTLHDRIVGTRTIFTPLPVAEPVEEEESAADESGADPVADQEG